MKNLEELLKKGQTITKQFINFNKKNYSPYNAVQSAENILIQNKFQQIKEKEQWKLQPGNSYYLKRGYNSSIMAFHIPSSFSSKNSFKIIGTHTDSPCIRLAPNFDHKSNGYEQVCLQMYGGGLWHTWLDRELGLGGRVVVREGKELKFKVYSSSKPLAKISTMAIHLKSGNPLDIKKEKDLKPIISSTLLSQLNCQKNCSPLKEFLAKELKCEAKDIVDFDLCFADFQEAQTFGLYDEFLSSSRIDNQVSFFTSINSIVESIDDKVNQDIQMVIGFDHEEIGSQTYVGANSEYLKSVMQKIMNNLEIKQELQNCMIRKTFFLSSDMAHAVHPNFSSLHQSNHKPCINGGIVLKRNANGRYTTDCISGSVIRQIADNEEVPLHDFIVPCDSRCGSTIGPMIASLLGCLSVDIGGPQLGMHSIRETCGVIDFYYYQKLMTGFLKSDIEKLLPKLQ